MPQWFGMGRIGSVQVGLDQYFDMAWFGSGMKMMKKKKKTFVASTNLEIENVCGFNKSGNTRKITQEKVKEKEGEECCRSILRF